MGSVLVEHRLGCPAACGIFLDQGSNPGLLQAGSLPLSHQGSPHFFFSKKLSTIPLGRDFPGGSVVKNPPANAGDVKDTGSIAGSGRYPGIGRGNPLQYSCLENPTDRGAWQAAVHRVAQSQIRLK